MELIKQFKKRRENRRAVKQFKDRRAERLSRGDEWNEGDHPRDENGQFSSVGSSGSSSVEEYGIKHRPTDPRKYPDEVATADKILDKELALYPSDFLDHPERYTDELREYSDARKCIETLRKVQGHPDAMVTIYRGAPSGGKLNTGDWVTLSKEYAKSYADGGGYSDNKESRVYEYKVRAGDLSFPGDSYLEMGYFGEHLPSGKEIKRNDSVDAFVKRRKERLASRMDADPESWITVNGNHIPLDEEEKPIGGQVRAFGEKTISAVRKVAEKAKDINDKIDREIERREKANEAASQYHSLNGNKPHDESKEIRGGSHGERELAAKPTQEYEVVLSDNDLEWRRRNLSILKPIYKEMGGGPAFHEFERKEFFLSKMQALSQNVEQVNPTGRELRQPRWREEDADPRERVLDADAKEKAHDAAMSDFIDAVGDGTLAEWTVMADDEVKPVLMNRLLSSQKARNASLTLMYLNYLENGGKPMDYQEWLYTPITLYRGETGQPKTKDDVWEAYTFSYDVARSFAGYISLASGGEVNNAREPIIREITIRPIDTLGSPRTKVESEVWIPYWIEGTGRKMETHPKKLPKSDSRTDWKDSFKSFVLLNRDSLQEVYDKGGMKAVRDAFDNRNDGGPGSGNWGHIGQGNGKRGGSGKGGGIQNRRGSAKEGYTSEAKQSKEKGKARKEAAKPHTITDSDINDAIEYANSKQGTVKIYSPDVDKLFGLGNGSGSYVECRPNGMMFLKDAENNFVLDDRGFPIVVPHSEIGKISGKTASVIYKGKLGNFSNERKNSPFSDKAFSRARKQNATRLDTAEGEQKAAEGSQYKDGAIEEYRTKVANESDFAKQNGTDDLTDTEKKAVQFWTSNAYVTVNEVLRRGETQQSSFFTPSQVADRVDTVTQVISGKKLQSDMYFQRRIFKAEDAFAMSGVDLSAFSFGEVTDDVISKLNDTLTGAVGMDEGFMACEVCTHPRSDKYVFDVYAPKGTEAVYCEGVTTFGGEREALLQRGTMYRCTGVTRNPHSPNSVVVHVEVVGQHPKERTGNTFEGKRRTT